MKKVKAAPKSKKSNNNKPKSKSKRVLGSMKRLAKGLVKAMAPKSIKKPQTKTAPKAPAKVVKAVAHAKVEAKPISKKTGPVPPTKIAVAPKAIDKKDLKSGKGAPMVAAVLAKPLTKPAKVEKTGKIGKMTAAQHAEHMEKMCRENGCENQSTTKGYCRLDYIKNWKKIKRKEMILKEGKLNQYIEELVSKYPDKYIDVIRQDLSTEVNSRK